MEEGAVVFLAAKKKKYTGKKKFHYIEEGETMSLLSDQYGIDLASLYKMNRMPFYSQPATGEKIRLKGNPGKSRIPRIKKFDTKPALPPTPIPVENQKEAITTISNDETIPATIENTSAVDEKMEHEKVITTSEKEENRIPYGFAPTESVCPHQVSQ